MFHAGGLGACINLVPLAFVMLMAEIRSPFSFKKRG